MKSLRMGFVGLLLLVAASFSLISYYGNMEAEASNIAEKESRARWAWILATRSQMKAEEDENDLSEECIDCNGDGFVGDGTIKVDCDTCNGTGKRGFQMTILKMPVQPSQVDCADGSCAVQGKPIRAAAKRGRVFAGRIIRKIRCRK